MRKRLPYIFSTLFFFLLSFNLIYIFSDNIANYFYRSINPNRVEIHSSSRDIIASDRRITAIAISPDGETIATGDGRNKLKLWSIGYLALLKEIDVHAIYNQYCGVSPDGSMVVSYWGDDRRIRIWSSGTGELIKDLGDETNGMIFLGISPDNAVVALASEGLESQFYLWSIVTGKQHLKFENNPNTEISRTYIYARSCRFTSDSSRFFINSNNRLHLWDAKSGNHIISIDEISYAIFSPDSKYIALCKNKRSVTEISIYFLENNELHSKFQLPDKRKSRSGKFSLDSGKLIIVSCPKQHVCESFFFIYDLASQELIQSNSNENRKEINLDDEICLLDDVLTSGEVIKLWSVESASLVKTIQSKQKYLSVAISNDGKYIAAVTKKLKPSEVHLFSVDTCKLIRNFGAIEWSSSKVLFSKDDKRVILCPNSNPPHPRRDNVFYFFSINESGSSRIFDSITNTINSISFSPDGKYIASVGSDEIIRLSSVESCELLREIRMDGIGIFEAEFSPAGDLIASHNQGNEISLWSVETGELVRTLNDKLVGINRVPIDYVGIGDIDFSPDGKYIAACFREYGLVSSGGDGKGKVKVWDIASGEIIANYGENIISTIKIAYSPDGKYLATTGLCKSANIWAVDTGKMKDGMGWGCNFLIDTSYDGTLIATGGSNRISFLNTKTGKMEYVAFKDDDRSCKKWESAKFTSLVFSPIENQCITGDSCGLIEFWRIYDKK